MAIPEHYTPEQLATKLQVSAAMVRAKGNSGAWPCLRLGPRTIRFTEAHYQQIVELTEHRQVPTESARDRNKRVRSQLAAHGVIDPDNIFGSTNRSFLAHQPDYPFGG